MQCFSNYSGNPISFLRLLFLSFRSICSWFHSSFRLGDCIYPSTLTMIALKLKNFVEPAMFRFSLRPVFYIPYTCHYKPWFVYFLPHFSYRTVLSHLKNFWFTQLCYWLFVLIFISVHATEITWWHFLYKYIS